MFLFLLQLNDAFSTYQFQIQKLWIVIDFDNSEFIDDIYIQWIKSGLIVNIGVFSRMSSRFSSRGVLIFLNNDFINRCANFLFLIHLLKVQSEQFVVAFGKYINSTGRPKEEGGIIV